MPALSPDRIVVQRDDLTGEASRSLISLHLRAMHAHSPPDAVFALDLSGLQQPAIEVWSARIDGTLVGIGALKMHSDRRGEIKSMRTHPDFLRCGVADAILRTIVERARSLGLERLSLETGSGPAFDPAIRFYRARGFQSGEAFGEYARTAFNQFFHRTL